MRVLIVGAGSVGQLYGFCLQRGGAAVDVYVREKYADEARQGYLLYDRKKGLQDPFRFTPESVFSTPEELQAQRFDALILCIPSNRLRGDWFQPFADAIGSATFLSLTPGLEDQQFITHFLPEEQVATGLITSVSYPAPLPGESVDQPGTAFWFPPLAPALFQGSSPRLQPLVEALRRGGMKSKIVTDLDAKAGFGSGLLMPIVATLETVDWSFQNLKAHQERIDLMLAAIEENLSLVEALLDVKRPVFANLLSATTLKGALIAAPKVAPFDLEVYFQLHFTKVGEQTRLFLNDYIRLRETKAMESPALSQLLQQLTL